MKKSQNTRRSDNRSTRPHKPAKTGRGRSAGQRNSSEEKSFSKRPRPFSSDKPDADRPKRPYTRRDDSDKPYSDRPKRSFTKRDDSDKPYSDRPKRPYVKRDGDDRPYNDRPKRSFTKRDDSDKPYSDRPKRPYVKRDGDDRPYNDRPKRPFTKRDDSDKPYSDRPKRPYQKRDGDDRPYNDRPKRSYGNRDGQDKPYSDRPKRTFKRDDSDKPYGDRGKKPFVKRDDKDKSYGDRPQRPYNKDRDDKPNTKKYTQSDRKESESKFDDFLDKKREFNKRPVLSLSAAKKDVAFEKLRKRDQPVLKFSDDGLIRLNKFIAQAGICSRREADVLIEGGAIKVNGKVVTELGTKIAPTDLVEYKGKKLQSERLTYILMNKPKDYITTLDDPEGRRTVLDLIGNSCQERIYPVGRLDRNTTGVLLLTNDGAIAQKLMHPSHNIKKIYQVELDRPLENEDFDAIKKGITLEDGFIKPDAIEYVGEDARYIGIEIHSGRNRIVRRIFEQLKYNILRLDRVSYAGLTKKDLPRGHWRYLSEKEVSFLKMLKG